MPPVYAQCSGSSHARGFLLPSTTMRKVLVLNTTYEPLNVCSRAARACAPAQGQGRGARAVRRRLPQRARRLRAPLVIRLRSYVAHPAPTAVGAHLAARRLRARPAPLPVLRQRPAPHRGPRRAALQGRRRHVGQPRHLVRALQPQEGRPAAARRRPAPDAASRGRRSRRPSSTCTWTTSTRRWRPYLELRLLTRLTSRRLAGKRWCYTPRREDRRRQRAPAADRRRASRSPSTAARSSATSSAPRSPTSCSTAPCYALPVGARVTLWPGPNVVFVGKAVDEHRVLDLLSTETDDELADDETI